jgi:hypothetical protein
MKHDQRTFGRRAADRAIERHLHHARQARIASTWCGCAGLAFATIAAGAGLADKPGAVLVAYVAAACSLMVAIAASSEA